jgi:UrcA family protein
MDTCTPIRRLSLISLALAGATLFAATAQAQAQAPGAPEVHTLTVKYSDLNITTAAGATQLYNRIRGAARFVCGEEGRRLEEQLVWNDCFHTSVSDAVSAVHSPLLSALNEGSGVNSTPTARLTK